MNHGVTKWLCSRPLSEHKIFMQLCREWQGWFQTVQEVARLISKKAKTKRKSFLEPHRFQNLLSKCAHKTNQNFKWLKQCICFIEFIGLVLDQSVIQCIHLQVWKDFIPADIGLQVAKNGCWVKLRCSAMVTSVLSVSILRRWQCTTPRVSLSVSTLGGSIQEPVKDWPKQEWYQH